MWSPDTRKQRASELKALGDRITRYRQLTDRFGGYFKPESDAARQLMELRHKLEDLQERAAHRTRRLAKGVVKIGVVGLEKQGKSAFLSAWLQCEKLLPSEAERCTWSTTVVEPSAEGEFRAVVEYYAKDEFQQRIASYFDAMEPGSAQRWEGLTELELSRLKASYKARTGHEVDDHDRASRRDTAAYAEFREIMLTLGEIKARLNRAPQTLTAQSLDELAEMIRPYIALKDTRSGNRPYAGVRAVKLVTVMIPVRGAMPGVVLMDLPGIDAPSDKARRDTEEALANEVDITIFVKDVTRPSLVNQELELLRAMQRADRSITLKDRLFVVLTKVDLFDRPDENGNWHWLLAVRNFKDQAIDRVYPYSKVWAHQGVDASHPVARQVQDFYNLTQPASGLEQLQGAIGRYLSEDLEALDVASVESIRKEFNELETRLRGLLVSVKENLNEQEFERRKEQRFDQLWEHIVAGEDAQGLLPAIKANLSRFMDTEISEEARNARAARANLRIAEIRNDLLMRLTPEEAESKRRQMPSPGLMNETAVEIEMRKQMRERVAARVAGLGEDFRDSARESIDRMLGELFLRAEYQGGRLEMLLPPGGPLLDRIDALGRSGQVSEAVLRYQNREIAKADVAFEVLSRYFARQIIDILDATDPTDREIREREMRGLEQFFGMDIADKATRNDPLASIPQAGYAPPTQAAPAGFPQTTPAQFPTQPVEMKPTSRVAEVIDRFRNRGNDGAPQPGAQPAAPQAPVRVGYPLPGQPIPRDWSKMLGRVRADVERICNFLEALAKHPRGLQKYHEEAVRTVHDSWLDREGEQSLRRWARSECVRIWPNHFAADEAEARRAREDIRALEELFGTQ
ncbi:MAG: dynamin family protein [Polyangiales bacterium]